MKVHKWTVGLAAVGLVSLPAVMHGEENMEMSHVMTALSSTTISGYVDTSAHWDIGTGNANAPGYSFNSRKQDGFNLNVVKLTIERPLDESQWAAGYKVDLLFGPDANGLATQSSRPITAGSDFGIKQAYVALRAPVGNGLDFKIGVFDTIIGYETFESGNNPNYTRSWGYTIEPTTHTGVLMSYQFNDMFSGSVGIANTFGSTINEKAHSQPAGANSKVESYKTYMGSLAFTAPEDWGFMAGSTLYAGIINGFNVGGIRGAADQTSYYLGGTLATPVEGLRLGAAYDYVDIDDQSDTSAGSASAVALYASLQATEKMSLHTRAEYANRRNLSALAGGPSTVGVPSKVFALTGTLQYDLWKNVISRLEARWDHAADGKDAFGGDSTGAPPNKRNHYLVAANFIYKF